MNEARAIGGDAESEYVPDVIELKGGFDSRMMDSAELPARKDARRIGRVSKRGGARSARATRVSAPATGT